MPDIKLSSKFDSFDEEKYEKYIKDRNLKDEDPCLFFDLKDKNYAIIKLPIPRFGRFIHISKFFFQNLIITIYRIIKS